MKTMILCARYPCEYGHNRDASSVYRNREGLDANDFQCNDVPKRLEDSVNAT